MGVPNAVGMHAGARRTTAAPVLICVSAPSSRAGSARVVLDQRVHGNALREISAHVRAGAHGAAIPAAQQRRTGQSARRATGGEESAFAPALAPSIGADKDGYFPG